MSLSCWIMNWIGTSEDGLWILVTGFWDDAGEWIDTDVWID